MATVNPAKSLQDEMTCPICLEYFKDPVSLDCEHNFCRTCIMQCWEGSYRVSCPQCRKTFPQRKSKPNRTLRNIVEAAKGLKFQSVREAETERMCEEHCKPLKLFCKDDQIPICMVCDTSKEHRDHIAISAEEAAEEFKDKIQAHLKTLRKKRRQLLECKGSRETRSQENLRKTQTERQKIMSEFRQLRQFLKEQERLLLAQLEKLDKEIMKTENSIELSEEISWLTELISEMEGKCQKPASEFLQDVRSTLSRCQKRKFRESEEISPEVEKGLSDFSQKTVAIMKTLWTFKGTLQSALEGKGQRSIASQTESAVTVTLDPDTAYPWLILSEDRKSVRYGHTQQNLPDNPERFDTDLCVLGCEGFMSGRHCWEVEVGGGGWWAVGVARESVHRKGGISLNPEGGIWAVEQCLGQFWALTNPRTPLPLSRVPSRIRVCLDCDWGQVTFLDAGDKASVFTFPAGSVPREIIRPWFWVWGRSQLRVCP